VELADRAKDLTNLRADQKSAEVALKKRHEELLAQQKAMFERQLVALESQLAETKSARDKSDSLLKELRVRAQELEAEQASLEERLTFALDDRDTVSRHMETMKEESERTMRAAQEARREAAHAHEQLTRTALALTQLQTIDREVAALRERAIGAAYAALGAQFVPEPGAPESVEPAPATSTGEAIEASRPAVAAAPSAPAPQPPRRVSSAPPAPERPAPEPVMDEYVMVNDAEVSFASVAPPAAAQMRAVAPLLRQTSARPSGRPTPTRVEAVNPVSAAPAAPLSDPAIAIPIDEDEG
jgi:hypothetical protein